MKIKDLMHASTVESCTIDTKLHNVAKIMKETNRGALAVVDKNNKVIGIVTDRDVCLTLATTKDKKISELVVKDAIHKLKVYTINSEDSVTTALSEMRQNKVGRLPVTDKDGKLKGVISISDLLAHVIDEKEGVGHLFLNEENLATTIKSLFERNNKKIVKKEHKEFEFSEV